MARFGINPTRTLGVSIPVLRRIAGEIGTDHRLAQALWASGVHEARILAGFIDDPARVTPAQMNRWAAAFDSWDVCDQVCSSLFDRTPFAFQKAIEWTRRREEFVRRAGFVLMAALAVRPQARTTARRPAHRRTRQRDERNFAEGRQRALRQIVSGPAAEPHSHRAAKTIQQMPSRASLVPLMPYAS
jgi:hypothetical protein